MNSGCRRHRTGYWHRRRSRLEMQPAGWASSPRRPPPERSTSRPATSGTGHSRTANVENTGDEPLVFLEMFRHSRFEDISVLQWMANTPHEVIADTIDMPRALVDELPKTKQVVL